MALFSGKSEDSRCSLLRETAMYLRNYTASDRGSNHHNMTVCLFCCSASTGFRIIAFPYGASRSHSLDTLTVGRTPLDE